MVFQYVEHNKKIHHRWDSCITYNRSENTVQNIFRSDFMPWMIIVIMSIMCWNGMEWSGTKGRKDKNYAFCKNYYGESFCWTIWFCQLDDCWSNEVPVVNSWSCWKKFCCGVVIWCIPELCSLKILFNPFIPWKGVSCPKRLLMLSFAALVLEAVEIGSSFTLFLRLYRCWMKSKRFGNI